MQDLEEMEQSMMDLEEEEAKEQIGGEDGADFGDWLDEFVVNAAKDDPTAAAKAQAQQLGVAAAAKARRSIPEDVECGDDEDIEEYDEAEGRRAGAAARGGGPAMSIASSYWRTEREDRRGALPLVDERFEHVAAQVRTASGDKNTCLIKQAGCAWCLRVFKACSYTS